MSYLNVLILLQFMFCMICAIYIIYTSFNMLYRRLPKTHPASQTPMVLLFFWFTGSTSVLFIFGAVYVILWWNSEVFAYHPMILYYLIGLSTIYVNSVPVADFYLCLDRCLAVAVPLRHNKLKHVIGWLYVATSAGIYLIYFIATNYFAFSTTDSTTTCVFYICLVNHLKYPIVMFYVKYIFCSLNTVTAILLLFFIKKKISIATAANKLNRPVLIISFFNLAFLLLPNITYDIFQRTTGVNLTEYIGDISMLTVWMNITLCVNFYWRAFNRHILNGSVGPLNNPALVNRIL